MNSRKDDINYIIRMLGSKVLNLKIHITKKEILKLEHVDKLIYNMTTKT